ncbi:MAG TPA: UDP-N-acetylglucosamine 2-epimerase (non-hydrolyzing) [Gemmatimonadales bacterium]|jgi:UDP-N-acetylglucosamine 2-epimerase (non-hydrolysing)
MPRLTPNGTAIMRILHVVGARPNFMKMAPVHRALGAYPRMQSHILHTGQHYDRLMSDVFFEDLHLPLPDISLGVGSGTHAEQTAGIMTAFEKHVTTERPDLVVVYGDVNSTMAAALVCAKQGIAVAHVEAGLRSGDRAMPEEINRIVTDRLANLLLVTEPSGRRNLEAEGVAPEAIVDTGNCMIDSLAGLLEREQITARRPRAGRGLVLITLHRPSNVDDARRFAEIASFLESLSKEFDLLFPVHPRTRKQIEASALGTRLTRAISLVEPLRYRDFVMKMTEASLIVTDSGGIQEESAYLGVPCLTLRSTTERPITVDAGTNILEPDCSGDLYGAAAKLMDRQYPPIGENPVLKAAHWDGHAGERVARELRKFLTA